MNSSDRVINALQHRTSYYQQAEGATLPYTMNYAGMLGTDTISTSTWEATGTATVTTPTNTTTTASIKISGSAGYSTITNTITTAAGTVDKRIIKLHITSYQEITGDYE